MIRRTLPAPGIWLMALRPFSFTASVVPAVFGTLLALTLRGRYGVPAFSFNVVTFALTLLGCVSVHAASNLVNDFFDFRSGVDKSDNFGRVNVLVRRLMDPIHVSLEAAVAFSIAAICGTTLVLEAGTAKWPLAALVVFGALSAYFYTAPPFALKNRGIGDIQVLLSFALFMVFGSFYVQAHAFSWLPVVDALPLGFLVVDILHVNNLRDLPADRAAGISTLAIALGEDGAKRLHHVYVIAAYVATLALIAFAHLTPWTLLVVASIPAARILGVAIDAVRRPAEDPTIVIRAARFHALFGALTIAGLAISLLVR